jgi:hypothetical protein
MSPRRSFRLQQAGHLRPFDRHSVPPLPDVCQFGKLANLTLREWPERLWPQESDTLPELAQTVDGIERDTGGNAMRDNDQFGVVGIVCDAACFPLTDGGVGFLQNRLRSARSP